MKEWSKKPTDLVKASSSPVKTVSSSPVGSAGSSIVKTSGSVVKTSGASVTLTGGSSSTLVSTSSGTVSTGLGQRAAAGTVAVAPLAAGTIVGGIAAVFYGVSNMIKYGKNEKSAVEATRDTVVGSAGMGLSAGVGVAAAHAIAGTSLVLGTTVVVPVVAGIGAAYAGMKIWDKLFFKKIDTSKAKGTTKSKTK